MSSSVSVVDLLIKDTILSVSTRPLNLCIYRRSKTVSPYKKLTSFFFEYVIFFTDHTIGRCTRIVTNSNYKFPRRFQAQVKTGETFLRIIYSFMFPLTTSMVNNLQRCLLIFLKWYSHISFIFFMILLTRTIFLVATNLSRIDQLLKIYSSMFHDSLISQVFIVIVNKIIFFPSIVESCNFKLLFETSLFLL